MERLISGNIVAGLKNLERIKNANATNLQKSKIIELIDFGIGGNLINHYLAGDLVMNEYGLGLGELLSITKANMQRLDPNGITRLGLYIHSIKEILDKKFDHGTIIDFGCGAWIDASLSLALDSNLSIQLLDISPLPLAFASYQLTRRKIKHISTLIIDESKELDKIADDMVMIIESSSFEHVRGLRKLFVPLLQKLPTGGLFLTNFTRLDWKASYLNGLADNKKFAEEAIKEANTLAYPYEWEPLQNQGDGWDLWEKK